MLGFSAASFASESFSALAFAFYGQPDLAQPSGRWHRPQAPYARPADIQDAERQISIITFRSPSLGGVRLDDENTDRPCVVSGVRTASIPTSKVRNVQAGVRARR